MTEDERLTLIRLALGKVSVACMRQSGKVVMPTEALLETAQEIGRLWSDEIATRDARIAELEAECEALRADVVWAASGGVENDERGFIKWEMWDGSHWVTRTIGHDGTDADILRAVREARTR